jgi:hypothetical protein
MHSAKTGLEIGIISRYLPCVSGKRDNYQHMPYNILRQFNPFRRSAYSIISSIHLSVLRINYQNARSSYSYRVVWPKLITGIIRAK